MTYKTVKDIICSMDRIARERGLKWMDSTMLLYALRWPEIFEDWEAISLIRQNVYEDEPTGLADLLRSATRTERDECFDMLEQVETGRPL